MTLGKRLYITFGFIGFLVLLVSGVNWLAFSREQAANDAYSRSIDSSSATSDVRSQMMMNRLYLSNYLLSGDTREVDHMNEGVRQLSDKLDKAKNLASSEIQKNALSKVQELESNWAKDFAQPLVEKRRDVDSGNATVAELQIFYLQKDPSTWVKNSTEALDVADKENHDILDARKRSNDTAATYTKSFSVGATLIALILSAFIAVTTARSISGPITQLKNVAHNIGNNGDLEQKLDIDTKRQDEIGELGRTFEKMVVYFKEMAAVSEAIASGDLAVEVEPRSKHEADREQ